MKQGTSDDAHRGRFFLPTPLLAINRYLDYDESSLQQQHQQHASAVRATAAAATPSTPQTSGGTAPALEEGAGSAARRRGWGGEEGKEGEGEGEEGEDEDEEEDKGRPTTRLGRVVAGWVSLLPDAARSWGRFEQFLEFIEGVSDIGDRERDLLLNQRMVRRLGSFFLQARGFRLSSVLSCGGGGWSWLCCAMLCCWL